MFKSHSQCILKLDQIQALLCHCQLIWLHIIQRMSVSEWLTKFCCLCDQNESRETLLGFNMVNYRACKNLWKACVEHHTFFRLERPIPPQKNFFAHYFTLGSKFRYWWEQDIILKSFTNYKTRISMSASIDPCLPTILWYLWKWTNLISLRAITQSRVEVLGVNMGCSLAVKLAATIFTPFASKFPAMFPEEFSESCFSLLVGGQRCSLCSMERRKALKTEFLPGNNGPLCCLILVVIGLSDINSSNFKVSNEFTPLCLQISQ